jgi:hypothetical protein
MTNFQATISKLSNLTSAKIIVKQHKFVGENNLLMKSCYYSNSESKSEHTIYMVCSEVIRIAEATGLSEEKVFEYVLLHEIVHSLDSDLSTYKHEINLVIMFGGKGSKDKFNFYTFHTELNAWKIADSLAEDEANTTDYKLLRAWCLKGYIGKNEEWVAKYCPDYF